MRRRQVGDSAAPHRSDSGEGFVSSRKALASAIKTLDAYSNTKVASEFTESTSVASKRLTLVSYVLMSILLLSELVTFLNVEETDHVVVDTTLGQRLNITLNVTFPALTCGEVHLDAMDVAGDYHPYMEQHITKQRLTADGAPIEHDALIERANVFDAQPDGGTPGCGSCFGAESDTVKCCDSCDELIRAYGSKGWSTADVRRTAPQCAGLGGGSRRTPPSKGEGCNLAGWLEVNKVGGNFHVALGESTVRDGRFIHQFNPTDAPRFNASHTIHGLTFGTPYPGMPAPLRGVSRTCSETEGTGLYQYFIKLVPTLYKDHSRKHVKPIATTRYSYTHRFRPLKLDPNANHDHRDDHHAHARAHASTALLPGVFFVYDLSAFMVEVTRHRRSASHFLVRVCAVVGGVFTLLGAASKLLRL